MHIHSIKPLLRKLAGLKSYVFGLHAARGGTSMVLGLKFDSRRDLTKTF